MILVFDGAEVAEEAAAVAGLESLPSDTLIFVGAEAEVVEDGAGGEATGAVVMVAGGRAIVLGLRFLFPTPVDSACESSAGEGESVARDLEVDLDDDATFDLEPDEESLMWLEEGRDAAVATWDDVLACLGLLVRVEGGGGGGGDKRRLGGLLTRNDPALFSLGAEVVFALLLSLL